MTTRRRPESERTVRGPLQSFDLEAEVSRSRGAEERQRSRRAITLRKGGGLNVVLLGLLGVATGGTPG